ncbi:hypothetical protein ACDN41_26850 [Priestia aryabhattai]|uniref:hypothetical protein n=1 Tax=Priestia aryabhattai TaxID=412384 RepID=UPI0035320FE9
MKNIETPKITNDMERIEAQLNILHNRETKKFQELAFAVNMENNEALIQMAHAGCMLIIWSNELSFEIRLNDSLQNYILRPVVFNPYEDEPPLYLNKINRKLASTIVQHMERIDHNLSELVEQRLAYFEELKTSV